MFDRLRKWEDLEKDRNTPFMVGHIVGCAQMAAHVLGDSSDANAKRVAELLVQRVGFFFEKGLPG